jgi:hypothetical protein
MGFCSVGDINTFLGTNIPTDDAQALQAIEEATAVIKNYCNQNIEQSQDDTVLLDGTGSAKLFLPELPVTKIARVEVSGVLLDPAYYALAENGVLWRKHDVWTVGARNISVTYDHGYASIPDDVKGVCYRSASRLYQAQLKALRQDFVSGVKSVSVGDWSESYEDTGSTAGESDKGVSAARTLLLSEKDVLNKYRYKRL